MKSRSPGAPPSTARPPRGASSKARNRDPRAAILDATRELLADQGVDGLTVEGVAARSGVAKTTIYRRWRSKEDLALAVVLDMTEQVVHVPERGSTRTMLVALVDRAISILTTTLMGRVMQGLTSDLTTDPTLGRAFRARVVAMRLAEIDRIVERGVRRGELRQGIDTELLHDLLFGPVYHRLLLTGGDLDRRFAERIVDAVLPSIATSPG